MITTDPTITTTGQTDYGKLYRGPTDDGAFSLWAFGSTSAFDTALKLDNEFFADPNNLPIAVFKFENLLITGNPTIDTSVGPTNLGLIAADGITSGPPGGTLTFTGLNLLALATVDGSINFTSDVSFQGLNVLVMYARGSGSDLILNSPISGIGSLKLAAENSIQLVNPGTMDVGAFDATAGNNLSLQVGGSLLLNGEAKQNVLVSPGVTVPTGADLTVNIANNLTNNSAIDFTRFRVTNEGAHIGMGGNISVTVGGDLTTNGPASGTGEAEPGDFELVIRNTNGLIDNGGNISLAVTGNVSTQGQLTLLLENYDGSANPAGHIVNGGAVSVTTGGNLTADSISAFINNRGGGMINSAASVSLNVSGALTTLNDAIDDFGFTDSLSLALNSRYDDSGGNTTGSMIGGDATVSLQADSASIGGKLSASLSDRGGTISGNALLKLNVTHDITLQGMADIELLNDGGSNVLTPIAGTIHGNATVQFNANNFTLNALLVGVNNRNGGVIDSNASINFNLSGDLIVPGTDPGVPGEDPVNPGEVDLEIKNSRNSGGTSGGSIGGNALIQLSVVNYSSASDLLVQINNLNGGMITSAATIDFTLSGNFSSGNDVFFGIANQRQAGQSTGGNIGTDATINVSVSGNSTVQGDATFSIDNHSADTGGTTPSSIGGTASITLNASAISTTANAGTGSLGDLGLFINNFNGGQIGADAAITLNASSISTDGNFFARVDNSNGGVVQGNASTSVNVTGDVSAPGGVVVDILNGPSTIGGAANVTFHTGGDVTSGASTFFDLFGEGGSVQLGSRVDVQARDISVTGDLNAYINSNSGQIGDTANVLFVARDIHSTGNTFFDVLSAGGTIGSDATVDVTLRNAGSDGNLTADISNVGGQIGGSAGVTLNVAGNLSTVGAFFQILNGQTGSGSVGSHIGQDASINVKAANIDIGGELSGLIDNTAGSITGNAIASFATTGHLNAGNMDFGISNSDDGAPGNPGTIGGNATMNVAVGGDLNTGFLTGIINDRHVGSIGGAATIDLEVGGSLITANDVAWGISTRNDGSGGGMIGSNATVTLNAGSVATSGFFQTFISTNGGGSINGNAVNTVHATGDLSADQGILVDIEDTGFGGTGGVLQGGNIGGSAMVTLSAKNITTLSDASGTPGTDTMALEASIYSNVLGTIGGDALVNVSATQNISAPGSVFFTVANGNYQSLGAGNIGGDAKVNITAANLSTGDFTDDIYNYGGSTIGKSALINLNVTGNISTGFANFDILNFNGGVINSTGNAAPGTVAGISVTSSKFDAANLLAQINNSLAGMINGSALVQFAAPNGITTDNDIAFRIANNNGGRIIGSADGNVTGGDITSTAGALSSGVFNYAGGNIGGNATVNFNLTGGISTVNDSSFQIWNFGGGPDPGGTISQNAMINVSAASLSGTSGSTLSADILNQNNGLIGQAATVNFNISGAINTGAVSFLVENVGGNIGQNASIDLSAGSISLNDSINLKVDNSSNGGHIFGDAIVNMNAGSVSAPGAFVASILNSNSSISGNAAIALTGGNLSADSMQVDIDGNGGTVGGNATIDSSFTGNINVTNDATVRIVGSDGAGSAAINFTGGTYNVGGTFLSTIDGNGAITFTNANLHADIVKVGVFGDNGTLTIGGGMISADTLLRLYAPGSNGVIDFVANVTLSSQGVAVVIAANTVKIDDNVHVTIGGSVAALVYTNNPNYSIDNGGNNSAANAGRFIGAGATTNPLSGAPGFDSPPPTTTITFSGAAPGNWSNTASWNEGVVPNNGGGILYNAVQSGGTLVQDIVAGVTIQQFEMDGGTLQLDNPLHLNAGLQFTGGTINGGNLFIAGSSTQSITMGINGAVISNSGNYDITFDGSDIFSGSGTFNNSGTFAKTTGAGIANFNIALNNSGTVSAENGTLRFVVDGTSAGAFSASAGATVEFASNWSFTDGTHFSGAGTIQLDNNSFTYLNGTITNTGTILLNAGVNFTDLHISDGTMLTGGGSLILSDSPNNRIFGAANNGAETLINVNNTISGAGQIGASNSIGFINQSAGVINATSSSNALIISPTTNGTVVNANGGGFVNQGLLEATAAGGLVLSGGQFNNGGGMIEAVGSGNDVYLENSVTISGGTLTDSGGGLIQTASGHFASLDGTSQGALTNAGTYQGTNSSATFLNGTINNTGTILLNASVNFTDLHISDGTMLTGGGNVILSDSPNNRIFGAANNGAETLINVNNTISGAGQIGASNSIGFINQSAGIINATSSSNALIISPTTNSTVVNANGGGFVNQGLLEATAAGGLVLSGSQFNNNGGMIEAIGSGNNVFLENSVTISGGTLTDSGGGLIQTAAGHIASLDGTSQGALTNAGTYQGTNSSATYVNGTINNTGTIVLNAGGNFTELRIADGTMLTGGGSVILSDSPNNLIYGATNSGTETLTNVNNTITGAGQIGFSNSIEFINQSAGVINATSSSNALIITPTTQSAVVNPNGGGFVNQGLLEATAAGGLVLSGGQFNNAGGTIEAIGSNNDVYLKSGVTISGGTLTDSGGGLIQTASGHIASLDGTSQGALTIAGTYQGSNNSATFLNGTINNTGTILINSTGNFTELRIADGTMLTGGGSVILSDSPNNLIYGATNSGTETLTNVNNTITGAGQIGFSNSIEFINQSVINATGTNALIITPTTNSTVVSANGGGFVNQGLLEATAAGGLVLSGGQFNNNGGVIEAVGSNNNVFLENGVTISGGTLSDSGGGLIQTAAGHFASLDGTSQGAL
ncbi:MAG: hypothetical protein QOH39_3670, partial [Verrucomicrobiota bacterium]